MNLSGGRVRRELPAGACTGAHPAVCCSSAGSVDLSCLLTCSFAPQVPDLQARQARVPMDCFFPCFFNYSLAASAEHIVSLSVNCMCNKRVCDSFLHATPGVWHYDCMQCICGRAGANGDLTRGSVHAQGGAEVELRGLLEEGLWQVERLSLSRAPACVGARWPAWTRGQLGALPESVVKWPAAVR